MSAKEEEPQNASQDFRYSFDEDDLKKFKEEAPWMKDAKHFQKVALSPSALVKIMMHCQSGVQKGVSKGGNPLEVMGMLLGRTDPKTPDTLVVTDAFPLPIEGFETRVVADDQDVTNHMIALGESLELTRKERFMGWYHSHPFDLGENSHCFLSQTDLSTQLQWQRAEDPHGNPFVAIVVDPLRSTHLGTPELKAFRAYPPEFSPPANQCPDGSLEVTEQRRLELWGSCWNRYYELKIEYFMSQTSRAVLSSLTKDYLWIRNLSNPPESVLAGKLNKTVESFRGVQNAPAPAATGVAPNAPRGSGSRPKPNPKSAEWSKVIKGLAKVADEERANAVLLECKKRIFSS